jgi:hypothetical protein
VAGSVLEGDGVADADVLERARWRRRRSRFRRRPTAAGTRYGLGVHLADVGDEERAADAHHADLVADLERAVEDGQ